MARLAQFHDCGPHGRLTAKQIAAQAGISQAMVYIRLSNGLKGEALVAPAKRVDRQPGDYRDSVGTTSYMGLHVAVRLAVSHRGRAPTIAHLREQYGMSRPTAYRWRAAFIDAGVLP